jgi:PrtD family type I secretion system ABC transporter
VSLSGLFSTETPLGRALGSCRRHFTAAAVFSAGVNFLYLAPTLYMLQVYDRVLATGGKPTLLLLSLVLLFALASLSGLDWLRSRILIRCGAQLELALAGPVITQSMRQPGFGRTSRSRLMRDFDALRQTLAGPGALAAFDAPWIPIYIGAAFLLHPALGLLCLFSCIGMMALAWLNERITAPLLTRANAAAASGYAQHDHISAQAEQAQALGMTESLVAVQLNYRAKISELQVEASFVSGRVTAVIKFLRITLQSAAIGVAAWLAIDGHLSPGALMGASFLLARCLAPVEQIVGAWRSIANGRDAYRALKALFERAEEDVEKTVLPRPIGDIAVEAMTMLTPLANRIGVADVSFTIDAGQMIGILGPSGSGKSSLLRALAGAAMPARGAVRIDGAATSTWPTGQLARHIGYLPQDFVLFPGTVKDNISRFHAYGPYADEPIDEMTVAAAKAIGIHELILRLPEGYDTKVGLGGVGLSGGQTQKIALARAFYGAPSILILDEPNAHLDLEGEGHLCNLLKDLREQKVTVIIAAHRGPLLATADKMMVLNGGRIQSFGSLADLGAIMRRGGAGIEAPELTEMKRA